MSEIDRSKFPKTGFPYKLTRKITGELFHPFLNIKKHGLENLIITQQTPVVFAYFPHTGHGDALVVLHALLESGIGNIFIPGAEDYWFKNQWKLQFASLVSPISPQPRQSIRHGVGRTDIEDATALQIDLINRGLNILWASEGTRNDKPLEERIIKSGFANLALELHLPTIPITLIGYDIFPKGALIPQPFKLPSRSDMDPRKRIDVVFGKPIFSPNLENNSQNRKRLVEATREVFIDTYRRYSEEFHNKV